MLSCYKRRFAESIEGFIDSDLAGSEGNIASGGNGHDQETPHDNSPESDASTVILQSHPPPTGTPSRHYPVLQIPVPIIFPYLGESSDEEDPPAVSPVQEEAKMKSIQSMMVWCE
jgi:hypothetical protein